jgi:hypothetical protein
MRGERRLKRSDWRPCALAAVLVAVWAVLLAAAVGPVAKAASIEADMENDFGGNAGVTVEGIRLGRHPDKLRIVLDATGPVNFDYWISESGKGIVILIPQVKWAAREYVRLGEESRIYRIRFFPNPTGGGVLSILGREQLGLSAVEQIGPEKERPYRTVFDIPVRQQDARIPAGGIMRSGKLLPPHKAWPPVMQAVSGRPLPVIARQSAAGDSAVSYARR